MAIPTARGRGVRVGEVDATLAYRVVGDADEFVAEAEGVPASIRFVGEFWSHDPSVVLPNPLTATGAGALMRAMSSSISGVAALAFDCADPPALAKFWQKLLGGKVILDKSGDAELQRSGSNVRFDFLKVPEAKAGKNRLHLDLRSRVYDAAIADALSFGATLADDIYDGDDWQVLRDPEGNEFCILRPRSNV
ncbi:hypothetical protein SAMN05216219_2297 [Mycetocola miduiensis]|uniref:Glyoxalase-like domain-containing protein n=2 Tax=Mycetocola miduiensis TaxID=995034 RepID=A0A1I5C9I2_9MICO|nr:hypothetical protein SAMN05216219_2297 [Mycetocola miduiensis]